MRCESKREPAPPTLPGPPSSAGRTPLSQGRLTVLLVVLLVPVVVAGVKGSSRRGSATTELPAVLVGTWVTDAPAYEGRTLAFAPGWVDVGRGGDDVASFRVRGVESFTGPRGLGYRVLHADADGLIHTLEVHMRDDGTLRLLNPADVVWRRR